MVSKYAPNSLSDAVGYYSKKLTKSSWGVFHVDSPKVIDTYNTYAKAEMAAQQWRVDSAALWMLEQVQVFTGFAGNAAKKEMGHTSWYHKIIDKMVDDITEDMQDMLLGESLEGDADGNTTPVQQPLITN